MKNLITKITTTLSNVVLFASACVMAGLGFAVVATLAFFALMAVGVALLASPFAMAQQPKADDAEPAVA